MGAHGLSGHSAKRRNPILHAVSPVSQNLYVESLNQFYIFLARKYASFGHFAFFRNPFGKLSHLRAKYGKSPQKNLSIFTARRHKFSPNVLIWSKNLSIMETTGWYLSIDICFVLVHCYVGMLMTSCLWGATPILGRKRITLLQPLFPFVSIPTIFLEGNMHDSLCTVDVYVSHLAQVWFQLSVRRVGLSPACFLPFVWRFIWHLVPRLARTYKVTV